MTTTPPGWYDDGHGALRWWDGAQWTEHVAQPDAEPAPEAAAAPEDAGTSGEATIEPEPAEVASADPVPVVSADPVPAAADEPVSAAADEPVPPAAADAETEVLPPELRDDYPTTPLPPYANPQGYTEAGYPGGFPGGPAPAGAFVAATEPKKSKAWIIWVVVGVVLLGIVIAAAVLIPLFFLTLAGGGGGGGTTEPSDDNEAAAVAAVQLYDEAWREVDCDKYLQSTTEAFRELLQLPDCETFEPEAQLFTESVENYVVTVTSIEQESDTAITVETTEAYDSHFDLEGNPVDPPTPMEDQYAYYLVPAGDAWAIDDAD